MGSTQVRGCFLRRAGSLVCVLGISSLVACSSGSSYGNSTATASAQTSAGYQLDPAVTSLRFNADAASVDLTAKEGASAISVTEDTHGATTNKEVTGSNAVLTSKCPEGINFGNSCRVDYTVTVPPRTSVDIEGAAGNISLTGPLANATVNTAAARINGTGLGAGTISATTNAGQVDLAFAAAPTSVQVKSDAGEVTLTLPGAEKYNVTVKTTLGSQDVSVDKDAASTHRIDVTTTIGAVTVKKG